MITLTAVTSGVSVITAVMVMLTSMLSVWAAFKAISTHKLINSRMDELLVLTRQKALAEGIKQEHDHPTS